MIEFTRYLMGIEGVFVLVLFMVLIIVVEIYTKGDRQCLNTI